MFPHEASRPLAGLATLSEIAPRAFYLATADVIGSFLHLFGKPKLSPRSAADKASKQHAAARSGRPR
jgi:hypothetical protein